MHDVCLSPDGKYVYTTAILARYQLPTTQVERGWMNTNGFSIIDAEKREFVNSVLLDSVDSGAANPWPIATNADGTKICVGLAGSHELCVVDWTITLEKLESLPKDAEEAKEKGLPSNAPTAKQVPENLAFLVNLKERVKLSTNQVKAKAPRCLAVIGDKAYLGMYYTDNIVVVNMKIINSNRNILKKNLGRISVLVFTPETMIVQSSFNKRIFMNRFPKMFTENHII
jgi:hypothetical protein